MPVASTNPDQKRSMARSVIAHRFHASRCTSSPVSTWFDVRTMRGPTDASDDARLRPLLMAGIGVASIVVIGAALLLWRTFAGDEPPAVALGGVSVPTTSPVASPDPAAAGEAPATFDGIWRVDHSTGTLEEGTSSFAGYRIQEELGGVGANTAVGRTEGVDGTMTIVGTSVTDLAVTVDMTSIRSDDERRDSQLTTRGLETGAFPTATFTLTEPISLPAVPTEGETISATAAGDLTLHGVTRAVDVPVQALWTGDQIEVTASLTVALADHDIEPPTGFLVLSIADTGTVEMHLVFRRG